MKTQKSNESVNSFESGDSKDENNTTAAASKSGKSKDEDDVKKTILLQIAVSLKILMPLHLTMPVTDKGDSEHFQPDEARKEKRWAQVTRKVTESPVKTGGSIRRNGKDQSDEVKEEAGKKKTLVIMRTSQENDKQDEEDELKSEDSPVNASNIRNSPLLLLRY